MSKRQIFTIADATEDRVCDTRVFHTLNGMRGIAAVAVVVRHAQHFFGFGLASNYLAVDLFFVLSGFVLAHAYERRFKQGMGVGGFMRVRFIRLFPLLSVAIAMTLVGLLVGWASGVNLGWTLKALTASTALNIVFLPAPPFTGNALFPLDIPAWSLFLELFVNLLYVAFWRHLSNRVLIAILAVTAVALLVCAGVYGDLGGGWDWSTLVVGFARVLFSFPAGVLIYRAMRNLQTVRSSGLLVMAVMTLIFAINPGVLRPEYDVLAVIVLFPVLVILGALARPVHTVGAYSFLGVTSYGVYAIHDPFIRMTNGAVVHWMGEKVDRLAPWLGLVLIAALLVSVWLLDRYFDIPMRRWLSTLYVRRTVAEMPANAVVQPAVEGMYSKVQRYGTES